MSIAHVTIEPLSEDRVQEAWPVLLMSRACVLKDWWESEATALIRRGGGILVARAGNAAIHGLATYEWIDRPGKARLLAVDRLVTFELNRSQPTKAALRDCLEYIALQGGARLALIEQSRSPRCPSEQPGN